MALILAAGVAVAQEHPGGRPEEHGGRPEENRARPVDRARTPEPHPGPRGYERVTEPRGWNDRPHDVDRDAYRHNFQAARTYHVGPYHRPHGWVERHWGYGEILPRAYWAPEYLIADYWLFSLEVPPVGFEWVRDGADALLVSTTNGEILQVEYGVFA